MRWIILCLSIAVPVAFAVYAAPAAAQSWLRYVPELKYIAPVVIGTMYGVQQAKAQEEAERQKKKEEAERAERERSEARIKALEEGLKAARIQAEREAQEAKIKAEREAANRRINELMASLNATQMPRTGTVYKLGAGWPATAEYCISYYPGLCSPCDYNGQTCDGHIGEPLIYSDQIK